ncbi:MAG: dTMP kinase [Bdellovibrionaceae bacterium]|nr:dTMP kinase [Pseudobdellovibrionaceae bacterium]
MKFIVFEGLDGAGKSTLISKVQDYLVLRGKFESRLLRDPGSTSVGEKIRNVLLDPAEKPVPRAEVLLYEAARAQLVDEVILPLLAKKVWVLSDRFYSSTVAFQAVARNLGRKDIDWLNNYACAGLVPDLVVYIDITVAESQRRLNKRQTSDGSKADRMEQENLDFHERVRQGYLQQAQEAPKGWLVLDGTKTPDELFNETSQYFERLGWLDN